MKKKPKNYVYNKAIGALEEKAMTPKKLGDIAMHGTRKKIVVCVSGELQYMSLSEFVRLPYEDRVDLLNHGKSARSQSKIHHGWWAKGGGDATPGDGIAPRKLKNPTGHNSFGAD